MKKPKANDDSDLIAFRSAALKEKLRDLVAANPGKITMTAVIIAAVEEKLKRLAAGEAQALNLEIPPSFGATPTATAPSDSAIARSIAKRHRNSSNK